MIYRDLYDFMMRKASSKEIDILIDLAGRVDWGMGVKINELDLARRVGTTVRYVREVVKKLSSDLRGKKVLKKEVENYYKLLKGKTSVLHSKTDEYIQKYTYLYTSGFKGLNIYGKRLILKASMSFSLLKQRKVYLSLKELLRRGDYGSGEVVNRKELCIVLEDIRKAFKGECKTGLVTNLYSKEEEVYIEFTEDSVKQVYHNYTERGYVRELVYKEGYAEYLDEDICIEIEKVGKSLFNYVYKEYLGDNGLINLTREVYTHSVKRFARVVIKFKEDREVGEVSAYFSSVVMSYMTEAASKYRHQKGLIESILNRFKRVNEEDKERKGKINKAVKFLEGWIFKWVDVRVKTERENKRTKITGDGGVIKGRIEGIIDEVKERVPRNTVGVYQTGKEWLEVFKNSITDYINILDSRRSVIK